MVFFDQGKGVVHDFSKKLGRVSQLDALEGGVVPVAAEVVEATMERDASALPHVNRDHLP